MEISKLSDEALIEIVSGESKAYKEEFLSEVRLELYDRGYKYKDGQWYADETVLKILDLQKRIDELEKLIPRTSILSRSFMSRAFAVWGHVAVAQLVFFIPVMIFALITR